jgi:hypothetical protein
MKCLDLVFLAMTALAVGTVSGTKAAPTQWPFAQGGNNHWYEFVSAERIRWDDACTAANAVGWHLVTITSQAENDWLCANIYPTQWEWPYAKVWLGATDISGDWHWVPEAGSEEPWDYTNFYPGEPNHQPGEYYLEAYLHTGLGMWNDIDVAGGTPISWTLGYVMELPEPTAMSLLALGGMALLRRRSR